MHLFKASLSVLFLLVCVFGLVSCAGQDVPEAELVLYSDVDPVWFERMEGLEKKENWFELKKLSAFVLAHDKLTITERAWAMYYAGCVFLEEERGDLCLVYSRSAANQLSSEIRPQILLGLAEFSFGNSIRGESILLSLVNKYPESLDVLLALGRANEQNGHWASAREWYSKGALLQPDDLRIKTKMALMFWREGHAEVAISELDKILQKNPQDKEALNDQGIIYLALGKFESAGNAFDKAISIDSGYADARLNRANFYAAQGQFEQALTDLNIGLLSEPRNVKLLITQGQIFYIQNKNSEAYSVFEEAHVYKPRNTHVLNELAWFLATCPDINLRNGQRAVTLGEQAALYSKVPDPGVYDTLAAAYAASGRFEEAVKMQETSIYMAGKAGFEAEIIKAWQERKALYERGEAYYQR